MSRLAAEGLRLFAILLNFVDMSDILRDKAGQRKIRTAAEAFLGSLVKGAKTVSLYKEGHSMIMQVVSRVNLLLKAAIGEEPNLTLELKAKSVLFDDEPLTDSEEMVFFAQALHTLGIGQVLFTSLLSDEGLLEFMKMLVWKADEERSLTDLQKLAQTVRIDGMQLVSILSFVVTGEDDEQQQKPGELTEEQVLAFIAARNIPDFLYLLYKQNEPLLSKEAETVTVLLDQVIHRDIAVEDFEEKMPWDCYDPRIRQRWDAFRQDLSSRKKWFRDPLNSLLSVTARQEMEFLKDHNVHEAAEAFQFARTQVHHILENPVGEKQPQFALQSYSRLLSDMGRTGSLDTLLAECELWRRMAGDARWASYLAVLKKVVQEKIPTQAVAGSVVERLSEVGVEGEKFQGLRDFILTIGRGIMPHLMEQLRGARDREARQRLAALLTEVCRHFGVDELVKALDDEDYFLVMQVIGVLGDLALPETTKHVRPMLDHKHAKVRATAVRTLTKFGGEHAVNAVFRYVASCRDPEEAKPAVTAFSLMREPRVGAKLIEAYNANPNYAIRVGILTALGRHPSPETLAFLAELPTGGWWDRLLGRNKELRAAAKASLNQVAEEMNSGQAG